jgi:hypothetical protein
MTHSLGPWRKGLAGDIVTEDGRIIASMYWARPEAHANARLVAAAPELLEALEDILPLAENGFRLGPTDPDSVRIKRAHAIAAKAKGEEA